MKLKLILLFALLISLTQMACSGDNDSRGVTPQTGFEPAPEGTSDPEDFPDPGSSPEPEDEPVPSYQSRGVVHCEEAQAPLYIWIYAHHYIGPGGYYPHAAQVRDIARLIETLQIPVTFYFDGIAVNELKNEDASLFSDLAKNAYLTFGYHGEETHGPYPVPTNPLSSSRSSKDLTYHKSWDAAYESAFEYANQLSKYRFITDTPARRVIDRNYGGLSDDVGGLKLVSNEIQSAGNSLAIGTLHGFVSPPVQHAFLNVADLDWIQGSFPLAYHALSSTQKKSTVIDDVFMKDTKSDVHFFMGKPLLIQPEDGEIPVSGKADMEAHFSGVDRSYPRFLEYSIIVENGDLAKVEEDLSYLKSLVQDSNGKNKFFEMSRQPNEYLQSDISGEISLSDAKKLAQTLAEYVDTHHLLPDYVEFSDDEDISRVHEYSLAESFSILMNFFLSYTQAGDFPAGVSYQNIHGPIGEYSEYSASAFPDNDEIYLTVSYQEIIENIAGWMNKTDSTASGTLPLHIPMLVEGLDKSLHAGHVLYGLAKLWTLIETNQGELENLQVNIPAISIFPEYSEYYETMFNGEESTQNPAWLAKLEFWTLKPARFQCL